MKKPTSTVLKKSFSLLPGLPRRLNSNKKGISQTQRISFVYTPWRKNFREIGLIKALQQLHCVRAAQKLLMDKMHFFANLKKLKSFVSLYLLLREEAWPEYNYKDKRNTDKKTKVNRNLFKLHQNWNETVPGQVRLEHSIFL